MSAYLVSFVLISVAVFSFFLTKKKIQTAYIQSSASNKKKQFKTQPKYFGYITFLWVLAPAVLLYFLTSYLSNFEAFAFLNSTWVSSLLIVGISCILGLWKFNKINENYPARNRFEKSIEIILLLSSGIAILTTLGIVMSVLFESFRFFGDVPVWDFMFGTQWSPQTAIRADQVGSSASFGAVPLFVGTLLISAIALSVAVPLGLMNAIYLSQYASSKFRTFAKPTLEILAGIPTVVYGFFAALTVAPFIRDLGESLGLTVASESALAAGLVMGIMITPFVSSLTDDVITAVPKSLSEVLSYFITVASMKIDEGHIEVICFLK